MFMFCKHLCAIAVAIWFGSLLSSASCAAEKESQQKPNILWIVSEDNGPFLGCYGYPDAQTPQLDQLAAQGILFQNAFATAPVCAPCRCSIITGMYSPSLGTQHMRSTNFVPPESIPFFVKYLRDAGYYCSNHSKTDYNLSPPQKHAWDQMTDGDHHRRAKGQPFFAVYNLGTSHESSLHKPLDQSLTKAEVILPPYHPDTPEIRANWAMYQQIIGRMDAEVGQILKQLEADKLADDTIVFYYADHGGILPRSKRFLYDTGVHVPLLVRFGKNVQHLDPRTPGTKSDELVSFVDLAPTVLSLAGVEVPAHLQGQAFLGEQKAKPREYVYSFRDRMDERYDFSRSVRDKRFKYIRNYNPHRIYGQHLDYLWKMPATVSWQQAYEAGKCNEAQSRFWQTKPAEELYDTLADPWEVNNLAKDAQHASVLKQMRAANRAHLLATYDSGFWPEGDVVARAKATGKPIYELVRDEEEYPLARIIDVAEMATSDDKGNVGQLTDLLADPHSCIRYWAAIGCLIRIQMQNAAPEEGRLTQLIEKIVELSLKERAIKDASPDVRITAAEALVELGHAETGLAALSELLQSENEPVALHAANAFECLGEAAKPALPTVSKVAGKSQGYVERATSFTAEKLAK
jgi:N-sulfoglucosamine sulfohydrolase